MAIYIAHFFAGFFLVNGVPHFVQGISGNSFQSPFARPPGVGEHQVTLGGAGLVDIRDLGLPCQEDALAVVEHVGQLGI